MSLDVMEIGAPLSGMSMCAVHRMPFTTAWRKAFSPKLAVGTSHRTFTEIVVKMAADEAERSSALCVAPFIDPATRLPPCAPASSRRDRLPRSIDWPSPLVLFDKLCFVMTQHKQARFAAGSPVPFPADPHPGPPADLSGRGFSSARCSVLQSACDIASQNWMQRIQQLGLNPLADRAGQGWLHRARIEWRGVKAAMDCQGMGRMRGVVLEGRQDP